MYNLAVFGIILAASSITISQLTIGEQFRIIADVGTSSTQIFGTLIAIFVGVGLVSKELDRRTCYAILARPVSRSTFILGKYLGLMGTLGLNVLIMGGANVLILYAYLHDGRFLNLAFFSAFGLMFAQFAICTAFAIFFSSFTTSTLATIFTLSIIGASHLFSEIRGFWLRSTQVQMKQLVKVLDYVLPNMGLLDLKEAVTYGDSVQASSVFLRAVYGFGYAGVMVALAALVFSKKDVR